MREEYLIFPTYPLVAVFLEWHTFHPKWEKKIG